MAMVSHMCFDHGTIFQSPIEFEFFQGISFLFCTKNSPTTSSIGIHGFTVIYVQKVTSIKFINIPLSLITLFLKYYTIDESIFILVHPIEEEKRSRFLSYIYI